MTNADDESIRILLREVRRLQAMEAVRKCIHQCARALDRLDAQLLREQFWDDARIDYGRIYRGGIGGFVDVAMRFQGSMRDTQHLVGNVTAEIDGERAASESYVQAQHVIEDATGLKQLLVGGRYLDRFERRAGEWRICARTEVIDWARHMPIPERWFEDNQELPKGLRDSADPSYQYLR